MAKQLSLQEWYDQTPPLFWIDMASFSKWEEIHYQIAVKWAVENGETWVYRSGSKLIFGSETDRFVFQVWAQEDFDTSKGQI